MRARPLSRREAALGAAMLVALALAWRETYGPPPLAEGPGRAAGALARVFGPVEGGHDALVADVGETYHAKTGSEPPETLRDAPADPPSFSPLLALPPLKPGAVSYGDAPSWSAHAARPRSQARPAARRAQSPPAGGKPLVATKPAATRPTRPGAALPPALQTSSSPARRQSSAAAAVASRRPSPRAEAKSVATTSPASVARSRAGRASSGPRFDLFKPTRAASVRSRRERVSRPPRFRPLRFDKALGPRAIRPPPAETPGPTLAQLAPRQPLAGPDGKPARWREAPLTSMEDVDPTELAPSCRARDAHWHREDERRVYHAGAGRGLALEDAWLWLSKLERRWWALPDAAHAPWLRHRDRWWMRDAGVWFVLHEGEPWAWRHFARWEAEGLIHPASGTAIVYSADFARAAVLTPGEGAVLFDVETGQEIARWAEHELPPRWRPAPEALTLPRGI